MKIIVSFVELINSVYLQIMKKILTGLLVISVLAGCSVFSGSKKTGCPANGAAVGAGILGGDRKATKAASKSKYKGGNKFGY